MPNRRFYLGNLQALQNQHVENWTYPFPLKTQFYPIFSISVTDTTHHPYLTPKLSCHVIPVVSLTFTHYVQSMTKSCWYCLLSLSRNHLLLSQSLTKSPQSKPMPLAGTTSKASYLISNWIKCILFSHSPISKLSLYEANLTSLIHMKLFNDSPLS